MRESLPSGSELDRIRSAFAAAAGKTAEERSRYLQEVFANEGQLRAQVEELLRYHDAPPPMLDDPSPPDLRQPQRIGRYRVLGVLGSGGIGVVYRAEQDQPKRLVALKLLQPGQVRAETLRRFALEADLLARLRHPGIAHIYETGSFDSGFGEAPFFAMELVEGETLTAFADRRGLATGARCALLAQVCDAVQHAHERDIVHRDLKPDNILVTEPNPGDPRVKILDFGIARVTRADVELSALLTHTGQMMGTLPYMSPEQLSGTVVDARSDVYSLGAILYELLAGRVPHELDGRPLTQVVRIVTEEEPERIGRVDPSLRGDLEIIVEVALAKEVDRRYPSAAALAADLRRFLHEQPIVARPRTALYQLYLFARRNRALVGGVLATLLVLVAGIIGVSIYGMQNRRLAASERAARAEERRNRYYAEMNLAGAALASGGLARVRQLVDAWRPAAAREAAAQGAAAHDADPRGFEWYFLDAASRGSERILSAGGVQYAVSWLSESELASHEDAGGAVFEVATGKRRARFEGRSSDFVHAVASPDGKSFAVSCEHDIRVFDVPTGRVRATLHAGTHTGRIVWIPGRDWLAFIDHGGAVQVWDIAHGRWVATFGENTLALAFSSDGRRYARTLQSGGVEVGEVEAWTATHRLVESEQALLACAFSPDGAALAVGGIARVVRVLEIESGRCLGSVPHEKRIVALAWSPDGQLVASGGYDCVIHVLDLGTRELTRLRGHGNTVLGLAYSRDGQRLASASEDGTLRVWPRTPLSPVRTVHLGLRARDEVLPAFSSWTHDGSLVVNLPWEDGAHVIDPRSGVERSASFLHWSDHGERAAHVAGGSLVVTTRDPGKSDRWALPDQHEIRLSQGGLALSPDGAWLAAVGSGPDDLVVWAWRPFSLAPASPIYRGMTVHLAWSPDGKVLALIAGDGILLVDPETGHAVRDRAIDRATYLSWSPRGDLIAAADSYRRIHVFRPGSNEAARVLSGHTQFIRALHWHPDGSRLASAGNDRMVKLWDVASGRETLTLHHDDDVCGVRWRQDGKALASVSADGVVKIWCMELQPVK